MNKHRPPLIDTLRSAHTHRRKLFAILIDPEKQYHTTLKIISQQTARPDLILVGGSQYQQPLWRCIAEIKSATATPVVIFPGNSHQLAANADAILLLSLISGNNPEYLIGQHRLAARTIKSSAIETIPTGYILIDGGNTTAVQRISQTEPLRADDIDSIVDTAIAGELLGLSAIYLEAGSGASRPISQPVIKAVTANIDIPLIVGGGIKTAQQAQAALSAGADMIVVGNHFESSPQDIPQFIETLDTKLMEGRHSCRPNKT